MKVMICRSEMGFLVYVLKKDQEELIVEIEMEVLWGGYVFLKNGWKFVLLDMFGDMCLFVMVNVCKIFEDGDGEQILFVNFMIRSVDMGVELNVDFLFVINGVDVEWCFGEIGDSLVVGRFIFYFGFGLLECVEMLLVVFIGLEVVVEVLYK